MRHDTKDKKARATVFLSPQERAQLDKAFQHSTCPSLSQYLYKRIYGKPVTIGYRNLSLDDFVEEIIQCKDVLVVLAEQSEPVSRAEILENLFKVQIIVNKILEHEAYHKILQKYAVSPELPRGESEEEQGRVDPGG